MKSRIGELIKTSKYKREYILKELGIAPNTLTSWSHGRSYPRMDQAKQLADLLEVGIEELYEETKKDR
ncbi:helix-turn-helix transcriptional regulator [Pseudobacillus sp. FSL P4-0506]|uniref:helix-turn-helix transcriptional regulator n=1 Tax=Pseudobacillus sp. FSL P4-0506 TaxID=2921576 RepID=UPI0030F72FEB